jgi:hypothetical protein
MSQPPSAHRVYTDPDITLIIYATILPYSVICPQSRPGPDSFLEPVRLERNAGTPFRAEPQLRALGL